VYSAWQVESANARSCRLSLDFDEGWPWRGRATQEIELLSDGIKQTLRVKAARDAVFPAGVGWHPWFRRSLRRGDDASLLVDADHTYEVADMIPTGWMPRVKRELDLRGYPVLGARRIDACYRHPRGPLRIRWGDVNLTMQSSPNVTHAVVFTPEEAVCVEPQTCAPDAFNLVAQGVAGVGVAVVDEKNPLVATTTWRWSIGGAR
jgi:galactose mutarotase-like enzyme